MAVKIFKLRDLKAHRPQRKALGRFPAHRFHAQGSSPPICTHSGLILVMVQSVETRRAGQCHEVSNYNMNLEIRFNSECRFGDDCLGYRQAETALGRISQNSGPHHITVAYPMLTAL